MSEPILELAGVSKRWRGLDQPVLEEVDLDLAAGSLTWIVGRNGAGKTTMLRVAAALILPEAGTVRVAGIDPESDRRAFQSRIGFLPAATSGLYARMTGRQHLHFWGRLALLAPQRRASAVDRAIRAFELEEIADRRSDRLSMGQRQRIRLAMTFLHEPSLMLLDEPRNSLDAEGIEVLTDAVGRGLAAGGAAIWCSPTGEEPAMDVTRLLELERGKLVPR